ncbi:MAG TPA: CZB domain-containing protein [Rhodocyclaceae bacterium]|nr:CZB domain-containing protein [Rhodocyclaceae bacterium]
MGIMDWFKQIAGGDSQPESGKAAPAVPAPSEDRGAEVGGLNFKSAVDAHMKWKIRLESYINGTSTEALKVDVVCRDDQCPLGKWIYSRGGGEFGYSETFFDMKAHHANFHRCAGEVLASAQAGEKKKALDLLHHGDYVRASERVKKLLAKLFVLVADGNTAIDAHVKWKERLRDHITGRSQETITMESVARDDECALGVWLIGEGSQHYGSVPGFDAVRQAHARFHNCAGDVLAMAGRGRPDEALRMLEEGEYARASDDVTAALVDLFAQRRS